MNYVSPQNAVMHLLNTGDKSVLKKVDPKRRDELAKCLQQAQNALAQKAQAKSQYQQLLAKAQVSSKRKSVMKDVEEWPTGTSYDDMRRHRFVYKPLVRG